MAGPEILEADGDLVKISILLIYYYFLFYKFGGLYITFFKKFGGQRRMFNSSLGLNWL